MGFENTIYGKSPLGGNCSEGGVIKGVPLFWDSRVQAYISEQAIEELDDRDLSIVAAEQFNKNEEFLAKAGFSKDATRS